jgi:hypothetical protein
MDHHWTWAMHTKESFPDMTGQPRYLSDGRTCVLPVSLKPGKVYAVWLNTDQLQSFRDRHAQPALPYLLIFQTRNGPRL